MELPWIKGVICLLRKDDKTLFIDYRDYPHKIHEGKYSPPGGKVNPGESSETAAIREVKEETNIIVRNLKYRGTVHFNNEKRTVRGIPMKINMTVDIYECFDFDDLNAKATEEKDGRETNLEWIEDKKILGIEALHEGDKKMFEWIEMYKEFEGTIRQNGEDLGKCSLEYAV